MLSTHILPEVEAVCDRAIIIASGRIVAQGTPEELRTSRRMEARVMVECRGPAKEIEAALSRVSGVHSVEVMNGHDGDKYVTAGIRSKDGYDVREEVARTVIQHGWPLREVKLERATLDLRVNAARTSREAMLDDFPMAAPTPLSPWGLRLPAETKIDEHPAFTAGLVEVQDEGSQLIALACAPAAGERLLDLCAGAGGKSLALASAAPMATVLATDSNRARLSQLAPRAKRAEAEIETRLLNPPRELAELADWRDNAHCVLVDAPCSGSGTWRRNPEGRWRLTPERLERLTDAQHRLLDMAAALVRPGGVLVYAVCSLLSREGAGQIGRFLERHSSWISEPLPIPGGRDEGGGKLLTPGHDHTDGFFVARLRRPC